MKKLLVGLLALGSFSLFAQSSDQNITKGNQISFNVMGCEVDQFSHLTLKDDTLTAHCKPKICSVRRVGLGFTKESIKIDLIDKAGSTNLEPKFYSGYLRNPDTGKKSIKVWKSIAAEYIKDRTCRVVTFTDEIGGFNVKEVVDMTDYELYLRARD